MNSLIVANSSRKYALDVTLSLKARQVAKFFILDLFDSFILVFTLIDKPLHIGFMNGKYNP